MYDSIANESLYNSNMVSTPEFVPRDTLTSMEFNSQNEESQANVFNTGDSSHLPFSYEFLMETGCAVSVALLLISKQQIDSLFDKFFSGLLFNLKYKKIIIHRSIFLQFVFF